MMKKGIIIEDVKQESGIMNSVLDTKSEVIRLDDIVEGKVLAIDKASVFIDIPSYGTGIIYGIEFLQARDVIRKVNIGDSVKAKIVELENADGYIELSLKEAKQALVWNEAEEIIRDKKSISVTVKEANKGGLIMEWQGIQGFLPASQLNADNYPKVDDGDKDKILKELRNLVGKSLSVNILSANSKEGKLIFTQKEVTGQASFNSDNKKSSSNVNNKKYEAGEEVVGTVTGVVEFGVFVKLDEGGEGLIHISEISWSLIDNPKNIYKTGDKVKAKVIEIKDGKVSLSVKAMSINPWAQAADRYKKGDKISGVVIRFNKYGALISVEEGVAGLMHISEFGGEEQMKKALSLGKICHCYITLFDSKDERMTLSMKQVEAK
jgi:small subunit ribosomal protein S1